LYEIDLKILLRKLGERLNFKILLNTFAYWPWPWLCSNLDMGFFPAGMNEL
jgi:hypothetical protein